MMRWLARSRVNLTSFRASSAIRNTLTADFICSQHRSSLEALDTAIDEMYNKRIAISKEHCPIALKKFNALAQSCLNEEKATLTPIGSLVFGLGTQNSDFDAVFYVKNKEERNTFLQIVRSNQDLRCALFESLESLIRRHAPEIINTSVKKVTSLTATKIPLLIIEFDDGSSIDITIPDENFQGIRNSNLVRYYLQADNRFGKMFMFIERLFDACGIINSKAGLFGKYPIMMTIVHFLQSEQCLTPWKVLPTLCQTHQSLVGADVPIEQIISQLSMPINSLKLDYTSMNKMSVSELVIRYFLYYRNFNFKKDAIYIDKGQARRMLRILIGDDQRLMIFDPYSRETIARSQYVAEAFQDAVKFACGKFRNGNLIETFPSFAEAKLFQEDTKFSSWRMQAHERYLRTM